jgi:hypothetical protein
MAEIEMERRRRSNIWAWVLAAVVLVAIGIGAWYLLAENEAYDAEPAAETWEMDDPAAEQPYEYREPAREPGDPDTDPAIPEDRTRP